jgi:hypothetical protein
MSEHPNPHFSFIVRCWRDASGEIHGWLVDVYTERSHPFRSIPGLVKSIEGFLSTYTLLSDETPSNKDEKPKEKGGQDELPP